MTTRFILVRHGETMASVERRFVGSTDVELTDNGRRQAEALAARLRPVRIDALHVSPLVRCMQTAEPITAITGRKPTVMPDIRECGFGILEGMTWQEGSERWGDAFAGWFADEDCCPPEGETWGQVGERVQDWFRQSAERYENRTVLAVTHGGPILMLGRHVTGAPREAMATLFVEPASVSVIQTSAGAASTRPRMRIRIWNDTSHLADPLMDGYRS